MPAQRYIEVHREGAICVLTLRREAKLNALSSQAERQLLHALASAEVRQSRCLVVTGGARVFSAGADVAEMRCIDPDSVLAYYRQSGEVYERIAALSSLLLAPSPATAWAAASSWRWPPTSASPTSRPSSGCPRSASASFPARVASIAWCVWSAWRAREWILLRRRFTARQALADGLVSEVVPTAAR